MRLGYVKWTKEWFCLRIRWIPVIIQGFCWILNGLLDIYGSEFPFCEPNLRLGLIFDVHPRALYTRELLKWRSNKFPFLVHSHIAGWIWMEDPIWSPEIYLYSLQNWRKCICGILPTRVAGEASHPVHKVKHWPILCVKSEWNRI